MNRIAASQNLKLNRSLWARNALLLLPLLLFGVTSISLMRLKEWHPNQLTLVLGVGLVAMLILGLLMARWLSRKTARPLQQFAGALRAGAQGDYSSRLPIGENGDMGLSVHFNQFMDQMDAYSNKLKVEVHERLLAEKALIESQALFDVFMAHLPALALIKDDQGRYLYVNAACQTLLDRAPEKVVGFTDAELWPTANADQIIEHDQQVMNHNQVLSAVEKIPIGASERHHHVTKFPILNNGRPHMLAAIAFDITDKVLAEQEKVELEQQLMQAQKMEAIGTLAGGIAHDFNNVLAAILGYVELAQLNTDQGNHLTTELDHILKATHRAKDLVRQILTFSRKTEQKRWPLNPKPLVSEALKLLRASLPTTIEIKSQLDINGAMIMANATQLHQVVMNLCTNAYHAMESDGGILNVALHQKNLLKPVAALKGVTPGNYLELSIRDSGHGITPALQERIFDPYFTTKAQGKGTGMGLAVVQGIVKSHGGTICVESQPNHGTCFQILFPLAEGVPCSDANEAEPLPRGDESVLFVDDEPYLVDLVQQMLARLGYRVTSCASSMEAFEKIKRAPMAYDIVITDMTMPEMTGDELAERIAAVRPDLPVVLCTGYSEKMASDKAAQLGLAAFIIKPVTINDLASVVRKVLDSNRIKKQIAPASPPVKSGLPAEKLMNQVGTFFR